MKSLKLLPPIMAWSLLLALSALSSCRKSDGTSDVNDGMARVNVRLTDGPASYDAIWLNIQQVEIITDANVSMKFSPGRQGLYNVLAFRNGIDTLLVSTPVPAGTISQIRLILGDNNTITVDGENFPLNTPSAQESELKLNLDETLVSGGAYTFWLDFDASKSILQTGNGQYKLKPVIRAYTSVTNGRIQGYILPATAMTTVYAINGEDTFSAIPNANGYYQLDGLPPATYQLLFEAGSATYSSVTVDNVQVNQGVTIDLGTKILSP